MTHDIDYSGQLRAAPKPRFPWAIAMILIGGALVGFFAGRASAAEQERGWIVWNLDTDQPWTSRKGHQATATGPTACSLSLHEASTVSPKGTRLVCRKITKERLQ